MIDIAAAVDAAGVVATHSGTCLAILIDASREGRDDRIRSASERLVALGLKPMTLLTLQRRALAEPVHV